jgi:hypothetical protein
LYCPRFAQIASAIAEAEANGDTLFDLASRLEALAVRARACNQWLLRLPVDALSIILDDLPVLMLIRVARASTELRAAAQAALSRRARYQRNDGNNLTALDLLVHEFSVARTASSPSPAPSSPSLPYVWLLTFFASRRSNYPHIYARVEVMHSATRVSAVVYEAEDEIEDDEDRTFAHAACNAQVLSFDNIPRLPWTNEMDRTGLHKPYCFNLARREDLSTDTVALQITENNYDEVEGADWWPLYLDSLLATPARRRARLISRCEITQSIHLQNALFQVGAVGEPNFTVTLEQQHLISQHLFSEAEHAGGGGGDDSDDSDEADGAEDFDDDDEEEVDEVP